MILIGLGANLPSRFGDPPATLTAALRALESKGIKIVRQSRIWLTAPVPISDQPWYHNAVVSVETPMTAPELLARLQDLENDFGRVRHIRNEPRVLDLDLLAYGTEIIKQPQLLVPHPRMHERGFVLLPLKDIAPDWVHPVTGATLHDLLAHLPEDQKAHPHEAAL